MLARLNFYFIYHVIALYVTIPFYYDHAIFRHNCRSHLFHCAMPCTAPVPTTCKVAYQLMLVVYRGLYCRFYMFHLPL